MTVVVDLDPLRRVGKAEALGEADEQRLLRSGFGELAPQRLAGVDKRVVDEVLLLAALRHGDRDAVAGLLRQRSLEQGPLLDLVREQDQPRYRLVVVELGEEGAEHRARLEVAVGARIVGAVAPVLAGAEEEHLDAGGAALLVDGEDVGLVDAARIDPLMPLGMRERGEAVAVDRRRLEVETLGCGLHRPLHLGAHGLALAGQERFRLLDERAVIAVRNHPCARRRAALDLVEEAGAGAALVERVRAGAEQERALERVDGAADRLGRGERAEIAALPAPRAAMLDDRRHRMVLGDQDVGERLVVAKQHVEARAEPLDEIGFEEERLGLGAGRDELHRRRRCDGAGDAAGLAVAARVALHALLQVPRLADVEHRALLVDHAIDAGAVGQPLDQAGDDVPPDDRLGGVRVVFRVHVSGVSNSAMSGVSHTRCWPPSRPIIWPVIDRFSTR